MLMMLAVVLFIALSLIIFSFTSAAMVPESGTQQRLRVMLGRNAEPAIRVGIEERVEQALEPLSKMVPRSPQDQSRTRNWLVQAGLREPRFVTMYYGLRVLCLFAGIIAVGMASRFSASSIPLMLTAALLGYFVPRFFLKRLIRTRQQAIQLGLPDALDLSVICVEAGLSLDQAMQRIGEELKHVHPALSDEFHMVTLEVRAGKTRADALRNLAMRVNIDDMRALVAVLLQTDRFGTSIAHALRVHSDALRTERRQRAEEAAAKTTIKMVPVLVFFVFPPMFFVTLGPAFIQLVRTLLPELSK
jgi:tight adherence protein C